MNRRLLLPLLLLALLSPFLPAAENIETLPDFKLEQLHEVDKDTEGSWVSLCVGPKGDLIASDQYGYLWRITPPPLGQPEGSKVTRINLNAGKAHGLLWAFDSLYFMGGEFDPNDPKSKKDDTRSLWRARDTKGTGQFDEVKKLATFDRSGEHGPHAIVLSPDGKKLYVACGNHTPTPDFPKALLPKTWQEDQLLPRMWDANGHARGILAPGGFIASCDPDGANLEIVSGGYRNIYDFAFDGNGEIFTYDSDMEWDMGMPWYRPTRIIHATSGSEFGWRSGSGKWPDYYPDSLPATVNVGPGSPTGIVFGAGAKFPAKYQRAMFAMDWSFGTLYAVHLQPQGASYRAEKEVFLSGNALPLADLVVRPQDGALYFVVGGRGTASALFRVTYTGHESTEPAGPLPLTDLQKQRREIEAHHHDGDPAAVAAAWPLLDHPDRYLRYAARIALEHQPVAQWQEQALSEKRPHALREAILALARSGADKSLAPRLIDQLLTQDWAGLDTPAKLDWLRACGLVFIRLGEPEPAVAQKLLARLDAQFPAPDDFVNRELARLLIYLKSPTIVAKAIEGMEKAKDAPEEAVSEAQLARGGRYTAAIVEMQKQPSHKQQIYYAFNLRAATVGWTPALYDRYFAWFAQALAWKGGNSFAGFLRNARDEVLATIAEPVDRERLLALATSTSAALRELPRAKGPGKAYALDDFKGLTLDDLKKRDLAHGHEMYQAALCATCHRFGTEGGGGGPDLTGVGGRMTPNDLLTAIIDPSKDISDQFAFTEYHLKSGDVINGRVAREDAKSLYIMTTLLAPEALTPVAKGAVKLQVLSKVSPMLPGMLNQLNRDEALDLLAFLLVAK